MLSIFKKLIFVGNTFHEIQYCGDLFSRIQELEYFAWIYFHRCWNFNNPAWILFCDSRMCDMEILWKNKYFQYLNKSFTEDVLTV